LKVGATITAINNANNNGKTYAQAKSEAENAYKEAKNKLDYIKKNGNKYTKGEYDDAFEDFKKKEKEAQDLGVITAQKNNSRLNDRLKNEAQKRQDAIQRLAEIEKQKAVEMQRFNLDMRQREIDIIDDSFNKRRLQLELNYSKELQTIREFELNKVKEQQEIEKEQWVKDGSKGTFKPKTTSVEQLPQDVKEQAERLTKAATDAYNKGIEDMKTDSMKALADENLRLASALTKQLADIRRNYAERIKAAEGNTELIKALEIKRDKEITNAYIDNRIKQIAIDKDFAIRRLQLSKDSYLWEADFNNDILLLKKKAAENTLTALEEKYRNAPTDELANEIADVKLQIDELNKSLEEIPIKKLDEMVAGFQKVTDALGKLDGTLGEIFQNLGNVVGSVKQSFDIANKDTISMSDYANQASTAISGIVDIINMVSSASAKRKQAEQEFYKNQIALAHEYALALNEQLRIQSEISGSGFVTDYAGKINDGFNALTDATNKYQEALGKLSEGKAKIDLRNAIDWKNVWKGAASGAAVGAAVGSIIPGIGTAVVGIIGGVAGLVGGLIGGIFGKKKKEIYGGLLDVFPELVDGAGNLNKELAQTLINTNQVDDNTKQLIQNALEWADAIKEANKQIKEVVTDLAGDLGNSLKKSIIDAWKAGEDASKNMFDAASKSLEGFVENMLYSTIFSDVFNQFQQDLIDSLNPASGDGDIIDDFDRLMANMDSLDDMYIALMDSIQKRAGDKGYKLWQDDNTQRKASEKGVQTMTQDSALEMNGRLTGIQSHTFEMNESLKNLVACRTENNVIASDIRNGMTLLATNSERILNHLAGIEGNTEFCRRLDGMDNDLRTVKNSVDDILLKGIKIRA